MGSSVWLVNSGAEAAVEARTQLEQKGLRSGGGGRGCVRYYVSDTVDGFEKLGSVFLEQPIDGTVQKIEIEKY